MDYFLLRFIEIILNYVLEIMTITKYLLKNITFHLKNNLGIYSEVEKFSTEIYKENCSCYW